MPKKGKPPRKGSSSLPEKKKTKKGREDKKRKNISTLSKGRGKIGKGSRLVPRKILGRKSGKRNKTRVSVGAQPKSPNLAEEDTPSGSKTGRELISRKGGWKKLKNEESAQTRFKKNMGPNGPGQNPPTRGNGESEKSKKEIKKLRERAALEPKGLRAMK